jgi:hypothetical protein
MPTEQRQERRMSYLKEQCPPSGILRIVVLEKLNNVSDAIAALGFTEEDLVNFYQITHHHNQKSLYSCHSKKKS